MTLVPLQSGHSLVWDATCPDPFATSYIGQATTAAGCMADHIEARKCERYSHLVPSHLFQPVAIKTSGVIGQKSLSFLRALGDRLAQEFGEARSTSSLLQRLSVAWPSWAAMPENFSPFLLHFACFSCFDLFGFITFA